LVALAIFLRPTGYLITPTRVQDQLQQWRGNRRDAVRKSRPWYRDHNDRVRQHPPFMQCSCSYLIEILVAQNLNRLDASRFSAFCLSLKSRSPRSSASGGEASWRSPEIYSQIARQIFREEGELLLLILFYLLD
jgi:hypothetical protein